MRTLQEKYNATLEENFSKAQFVRDARLELPNMITQFNGFEDSVSILKNRGMIFEDKKAKVPEYDNISFSHSLESIERAIDYELEGMGLMSNETISEEDFGKAKKKAEKNLKKDPNHYLHLLSGDSKKVDKHDQMIPVKKGNHVDTFNGLKKAQLREEVDARLDPYEDRNVILKQVMALLVREKGASREELKGFINTHMEDILNAPDDAAIVDEFEQYISVNNDYVDEKKGKDHDGDGDIDGDDYMMAKDKAIKGSMSEGRRRKTKGGKVVTENDYETGGYVESMGPLFDKGVNFLIKAWEEWKMGPMTEPGMVEFAKKDVLNYLETQFMVENLEEDYKPSHRAYNVIDGKGNIVYKELPRHTAIEKASEREDYGFVATDSLAEDGIEEHKELKEAFKAIITKVLQEEMISEAATGNLSRVASSYDDFEGMQTAVNSLENVVTEVESFYAKTKEKIQKVYDSFKDIKNVEGLAVGAMLAPAIESAFKKDLIPVTEKGFTRGLEMPKVKVLETDGIAEEELDEKETVFTPINEALTPSLDKMGREIYNKFKKAGAFNIKSVTSNPGSHDRYMDPVRKDSALVAIVGDKTQLSIYTHLKNLQLVQDIIKGFDIKNSRKEAGEDGVYFRLDKPGALASNGLVIVQLASGGKIIPEGKKYKYTKKR